MDLSLISILFVILAVISIFSALMLITRKNPVTSALYLILNFFTVSGIYLLLKAQFIAIIQVMVYMGAIMVLFLFVIMLLNLRDEKNLTESFSFKKLTSVLLSITFFVLIGTTFYFGFSNINPSRQGVEEKTVEIGKATFLGEKLFTEFAMPVLIAGILLLVAIIGAVVLAKKKFDPVSPDKE